MCVSVAARAADRTAALRDLTRRLDEVGAEVDGYGDAAASIDTGVLGSGPSGTPGSGPRNTPRQPVSG